MSIKLEQLLTVISWLQSTLQLHDRPPLRARTQHETLLLLSHGRTPLRTLPPLPIHVEMSRSRPNLPNKPQQRPRKQLLHPADNSILRSSLRNSNSIPPNPHRHIPRLGHQIRAPTPPIPERPPKAKRSVRAGGRRSYTAQQTATRYGRWE